jgi:hypothetical protein
MGADCGTGHASGMRKGAGGPSYAASEGGDLGPRVAAFAGGLASALAAPLIAVRVEPRSTSMDLKPPSYAATPASPTRCLEPRAGLSRVRWRSGTQHQPSRR